MNWWNIPTGESEILKDVSRCAVLSTWSCWDWTRAFALSWLASNRRTLDEHFGSTAPPIIGGLNASDLWPLVGLGVNNSKFSVILYEGCGPGELRRYSGSLRAGRSGKRIPMGTKFSTRDQTGSGAHSASCIMDTGSFKGVRWRQSSVNHPPLSRAEVKEGVQLYLCFLFELSC